MLLNLSLVTQTLVNLIREHVKASPASAGIGGLNVSGLPPDQLTLDNSIGMFLYHITEDAHVKNAAPVSADTPPIRFTPMGLNLYYQLCAHSPTAGDPGIQRLQLLTGLAMKALRDFPVIDDSTEISGFKIFPVDLQGTDNRFRITLQPISHSEAVSYWTPGESALKLAAYYQVSVILLEPEKPIRRTGRVLKYGIVTFTRGAPRLDGSRANVTFTIPGETAPTTVEAQPAEATVRNLVTNTGGEIVFFGTDLAGDEVALLLKNKLFAGLVEVGSDWGVISTEDRIFAVVQPAAGLEKVLPGIYSAIAKVTTRRMGADKKIRTFINTSNETPFVVSPRIDSISAPSGTGVVTVTGTVFQDPDIPSEAVEVFVGANKLPLKGVGPLNPGEFEVTNATTLQFRFPIAGIVSNETVPFRLIINGAESAPNWVVAP